MLEGWIIKFLKGEQIRQAIHDAVAETGTYDLALAYWGASGPDAAGIPTSATVRILCDAYSGACNPDALLRLVGMGNVTVRAKDKLHSKIYLTDGSAIVGSANASANGLGGDGAEPGTIEAAVQFDDAGELAKAKAWFEDRWNDSVGQPIDTVSIPDVRKAWERARRGAPLGQPGVSFLDDLLADPEKYDDRPVRVLVYQTGGFSKEGEAHYQKQRAKHYSKEKIANYDRRNVQPYYEDYERWDVAKDDYVVDFSVSSAGRKPVYNGIWRILDAEQLPDSGGWLTYAEEVDDIYGRVVGKSDQSRLAQMIQQFLRANRAAFTANEYSHEFSIRTLTELLKPAEPPERESLPERGAD